MIQIIISLIKLVKLLFSSKKSPGISKAMAPNNRKPNIKLLASSPDLNKSIIELDNYISEKCEWGYSLNELSQPEKVFYYNQQLEREVNNGGFLQYFRNTSGNFAAETVEALKDINANKTSRILASAIDIFPDKKIPADRDLRNKVMDDIEADARKKWNTLDEQFLKYEDNLNQLNIEFVRKNIQYF